MRVKIHISYDGTDYFGWQKQSEKNRPTIQGDFEKALKQLTGKNLKTQGAGRTDRGVHALDQVSHFDLPQSLDFKNFDWVRGLNCFLPPSIRATKATLAPKDFHATHLALSKTYIYQIQDGSPSPNPLISRYSHWVKSPIDLDYVQKLSHALMGEHDFKSFQTLGTALDSTVRQITTFEWKRVEPHFIQVTIKANGFFKTNDPQYDGKPSPSILEKTL